jgi:RNA polymerase sigma-70 factor (ECF subfamily)
VPHDIEQAFLQLVRENDARLWRICRLYARDADAQEDLYQDMLVQLWRSLPSFAGESLPGTWLYRVALNTALSERRRTATRRETPLDMHAKLAADAPRADERMESEQRVERLYAAIGRLSDIDKMLVTLYLDEKNYREMADILGISESNVGVKLHRIKSELAGELAEERT